MHATLNFSTCNIETLGMGLGTRLEEARDVYTDAPGLIFITLQSSGLYVE